MLLSVFRGGAFIPRSTSGRRQSRYVGGDPRMSPRCWFSLAERREVSLGSIAAFASPRWAPIPAGRPSRASLAAAVLCAGGNHPAARDCTTPAICGPGTMPPAPPQQGTMAANRSAAQAHRPRHLCRDSRPSRWMGWLPLEVLARIHQLRAPALTLYTVGRRRLPWTCRCG